MRRALRAVAVAAALGAAAGGKPPADWDCTWRALAYDYAAELRPDAAELRDVFDALELGTRCGRPAPATPPRVAPSFPIPAAALFVDYARGSDAAAGTEAAPLRTVSAALRRAGGGGAAAAVVLRAGRHYVDGALALTAAHSGLTLQNYPGEEAWVVGGRPVTAEWAAHDVSPGRNVWVADVTGAVRALRVGGGRATAARYPNADPERDQFPVGWIPVGDDTPAAEWWGASDPGAKGADTRTVTSPNRSAVAELYTTYSVGVGGECANFDPPVSYWCSQHVSGGGAHHYTYPRGVAFTARHLPREWGNWTPGSGAELHAWRPSHWATWMFEVANYSYATKNISFGRGGFQGARGSAKGDQWFVSHVFDELDAPGEYFYDAAAGKLYLYYNGTGAPPADGGVVAVTAKVLLSANASRAAPVRNVTVRGVGFRDAAPTYLDPHGVPSGGDWALQRTGAVFLQGTEGFRVDSCRFERVDGNAVMVSGYNRDAEVTRSSFAWIGDSAMAAWGITDELGESHGFDGTDGNYPLRTRITSNVVRELGIYEKQSSMWFQAKAARSVVSGNLFFNGPRAGINFNDGFGGGDEVARNLIFNTCRESGDHGPVNSWDRQPFLTTVRDGTPSPLMADRQIHHNFIVSNYHGYKGIDNDDGSSYYQIHHNFLVGGWMHKSNYGGHSKQTYSNIGAFAVYGMRMNTPQLPAVIDGFYNNTCVFQDVNSLVYAEVSEVPGGKYQRIGNNTVYTSGPGVVPTVGFPPGKSHSSYMPMKKWLSLGLDNGTTWTPSLPNSSDIAAWGRQLLWE